MGHTVWPMRYGPYGKALDFCDSKFWDPDNKWLNQSLDPWDRPNRQWNHFKIWSYINKVCIRQFNVEIRCVKGPLNINGQKWQWKYFQWLLFPINDFVEIWIRLGFWWCCLLCNQWKIRQERHKVGFQKLSVIVSYWLN